MSRGVSRGPRSRLFCRLTIDSSDLFCLICCSTLVNCTSWVVNCVESIGDSGSWYLSCWVSSFRNESKFFAKPVMSLSAVGASRDGAGDVERALTAIAGTPGSGA